MVGGGGTGAVPGWGAGGMFVDFDVAVGVGTTAPGFAGG